MGGDARCWCAYEVTLGARTRRSHRRSRVSPSPPMRTLNEVIHAWEVTRECAWEVTRGVMKGQVSPHFSGVPYI
jgi:hypothetical protein